MGSQQGDRLAPRDCVGWIFGWVFDWVVGEVVGIDAPCPGFLGVSV